MTQTDIKIFDTDSHVTEPHDLWTSRISTKQWGDAVPHVVVDERYGLERWKVGDALLTPVAITNVSGWKDPYPSFPPSLADADPGGHDAVARAAKMRSWNIGAQLLYPNLIAFYSSAFRRLDPALALECVEAYNDFLVDFAEQGGDARFIPIMMLPFWDVEASVREMERSAARGHRGVLFAAHFDRLGLPDIRSERWHPILDAAQSSQLPINFHIGFGTLDDAESFLNNYFEGTMDRAEAVQFTAGTMLSNSAAIASVILGGVCERYPNLDFVSVESGFGYIPWLLQALDWHFVNDGVRLDYPEMLLPSEYFKRQVYATFWYERVVAPDIIALQDNAMFSTDYPHPTSISPGPASSAKPAPEMAKIALAGVPEEVQRKVLWGNAARVYHLD